MILFSFVCNFPFAFHFLGSVWPHLLVALNDFVQVIITIYRFTKGQFGVVDSLPNNGMRMTSK